MERADNGIIHRTKKAVILFIAGLLITSCAKRQEIRPPEPPSVQEEIVLPEPPAPKQQKDNKGED